MQLLLGRNWCTFEFFVYLNGFAGLFGGAVFVFDCFTILAYHILADLFGLCLSMYNLIVCHGKNCNGRECDNIFHVVVLKFLGVRVDLVRDQNWERCWQCFHLVEHYQT